MDFQETKARAARGDAQAQWDLAGFYATGEDVAQDYTEAVRWFRKLAEQGYPAAQAMLGKSYARGEGVAKDRVEAVKWLRKSAEQGYAVAHYDLGLCYNNGKGVPKDYAEAYAWYNLSSMTNKDAVTNRDDLEKRMSPQQVADAQKRTTELRAQIEARLKSDE
jgi:TPR repeat protein